MENSGEMQSKRSHFLEKGKRKVKTMHSGENQNNAKDLHSHILSQDIEESETPRFLRHKIDKGEINFFPGSVRNSEFYLSSLHWS